MVLTVQSILLFQHKDTNMEISMKLSEFRKKFGEGTDFDLDWGKLVILFLCVYIAIQIS